MKSKRLIALLLAAMMLVTLSACGTTPPAATAVPATTAAATAATATEAAATATPVASAPAGAQLTTITTFIVQQASGLTDVKTNTFTVEMEAKTNVHLDMTVVPADGAREKLNLLLASGDYPEILVGAGFSNADLVKYGTQEKILIPLNDLIDKNADNMKQRMSENPTYKSDMTAPDGNIYGIPSCDSGITGHGAVGYKLWMNMEWLKTLKMAVPTTTEEFKNVLMAFKTKDPNGNGKADEIPLTGAIKTWAAEPYLNLLNAFDYFDMTTFLKLKDGKITFTANTDGFKEGLKYIADLYKAGLIDPAAFTQNEQQMAAIGNNKDIAIAGAATCGHIGMFVGVNEVARCSQYDNILPLKGSNGYQSIPYAKIVRVSGAAFAITDKCKNPDIAMKWADLFCNEDVTVRSQVGIKGKQWDTADAGAIGMDGKTPATRKYLTFTTSGEIAKENDCWGWTLRLLEPNWKGTFQVKGDINDPTNYEAKLYRDTIKLLPLAANVDQMPPFFLNEADSAKISQIQTALTDYITASIVEFITGKKNVDTDWATYTAGLTKLQFEEYVKLNQAAVDALKK